jgi:hypothetical protein
MNRKYCPEGTRKNTEDTKKRREKMKTKDSIPLHLLLRLPVFPFSLFAPFASFRVPSGQYLRFNG